MNVAALHQQLEAAQTELEPNDDVLAGLRASLAELRGKIDRIVAAIVEVGHSAALVARLTMLETQAAGMSARIAEEEADRAPTPLLQRHQVDAALRVIADHLHEIFDESEDPTIVALKVRVRGMIEKIVVQPQQGAPASV